MRRPDNFEILPPNSGDARWLPVTHNGSAPGYGEHDFSWERVIRILRKNFGFGLFFAAGLTGLVVLYAMLQHDYYRPTARLEIAPPSSGIKTVNEIESAPEADNLDYFQTQVQILGSDALAVSVIRELHLDKNPEFVNKQNSGGLKASEIAVARYGPSSNETAILQEQLDLANLTPAESIALEQFRRNLSVNAVRNTRLIEISFSSQDPKLAQSVTNMLVTKFIDQNYKHRYTNTMQASAWLSSQLSDLRVKVNESAQAVADYQKKYGLVEVDERDVPMSQLMNDVSRQFSEAQANRIEAEAYVRMIDEGHGDAIPGLRDDRLYQDLLTRYSDLRTQLAEAKTVYGDANTNVQKLQDQIAEVSVQIDAQRNRDLTRTRVAYSAAVDREKLMMDEREKLRANIGHMSSQLAAYQMLKNEANANAALYNTLQNRLQEAGIYAGLGASNIRIVDMAMNLLKPTGPHRSLLVAFGAMVSLLLAVALAMTRESFRTTVRTPSDVKSWTGLPTLALLPEIGRRKFLKSWPIINALTAESEAVRDLRTLLVNVKQGQAPGVFLISSPMEAEGKTTVAVNFALALAQLGKTCLVDADLRQPAVAQAFKIQPASGLTDHLIKPSALNGTLVYLPNHKNLAILASGTASQNPCDLLSSAELGHLLGELKGLFEYIVIDSPPVIPFSDARYLALLADEVVLVGRYGVTTRRALQRSAERLHEVDAPVAGVVLNGVDMSSPDYNYGTHGYRKWRGRAIRESLRNGAGRNGPGDGGKPGAMAAHA